MNINRLILNNFRGIEDLEIELEQGKALIISGPNGAGKSSILGAIDDLLTSKAIDFALVAGVGLDNATLKLEAKTEVAV